MITILSRYLTGLKGELIFFEKKRQKDQALLIKLQICHIKAILELEKSRVRQEPVYGRRCDLYAVAD